MKIGKGHTIGNGSTTGSSTKPKSNKKKNNEKFDVNEAIGDELEKGTFDIPKKGGWGDPEKSKQLMKENKEYYNYFLKHIGKSELPKDSRLNWLQIASLIRLIDKNSSDYKADPLLDQINLENTYDENKDMIKEYYPQMDDYELNLIANSELIKEKEEFAESTYIDWAEEHPEKAIQDSSKKDQPVRRITANRPISKAWLKNPSTKTAGDYEGIDDGSNPLKKSDFSKFDNPKNDYSFSSKPGLYSIKGTGDNLEYQFEIKHSQNGFPEIYIYDIKNNKGKEIFLTKEQISQRFTINQDLVNYSSLYKAIHEKDLN